MHKSCDDPKFIIAAAPYLHCKPSTPLFADNARRQYLNSSTSLTGSASPTDGTPFASVEEAMDYLRKNGAGRGSSPDE